MQGAEPQYQDIQTTRFPFISNPNNRDTVTSKDQRFINCYFDVLSLTDGSKKFYLVKRPGTSQFSQPAGTTGVGRGTYSWKGNLYAVIGTKIYKGSTDLGVTLTTSTGLCGITETRPGAATQYLGVNDGAKLYLINTGGAVTTITTNFPNPNTTDLIYFDQYFFTLDVNGKIYQSNADDPTTWDSSKVINVQMYNGVGVGLARQNNLLFAFTDRHFQGFYDAANASGSVLTNVEQAAQQLGLASQNSLVHDETLMLWVSNSNRGGYGVMKMEGISGIDPVSTPGIERILRNEGTSISSCIGSWLRVAGKTLYVLKLTGSGRTLVYDVIDSIWMEWQSSDGSSALPFVCYTQHNNALLAQHATNGWIYTVSESIYQDDSVNFTVLGRFRRQDLDDNRRKTLRKVRLIGDIQSSTTNVLLQYSDDDYATLSTARTFDMSQSDPYSTRFGNFKRRAWQISYAGTGPLRLEALEIKLRLSGN